jgi:hypothetical protein
MWCVPLISLFNEIPMILIEKIDPGNAKGGSITVPLTSCLTGLE